MSFSFPHQGIAIRYEIIGSGQPLVFCHGLGGDLAQPKRLAGEVPGWQTIVWDCRFHGETGPDSETEELNFEIMAGDLEALLDHLRIESAVIGGISMGAGVAVRFAAAHPRRARALILIRPAWTDSPHPPNLALLEQIGKWLEVLEPMDALRRLQNDEQFIAIVRQSADCAESLRQQCRNARARERSLRLRAMPASVPVGCEQHHHLTQPVLVIGNEPDPMHPMSIAEWWASALGGAAALRQVPSKAHDALGHERAIRQHIEEFLAAVPEQCITDRWEHV